MKSYYDILEIAKDASSTDIKRAYFSKVKKNRPEDDPEAFKLLRLAYETLMDVGARKKYDERFDVPDEIAADLFEVTSLIENHRYKGAIVRLKQLMEKYPESPEFEYLLGEAYISVKSSGHAVKHLDQAASKYPDNLKIQTLLAKAYHQRGWTNKAREQFWHAISIDRKNPMPWAAYIRYCMNEMPYLTSTMFSEAMAINESMFIEYDYRIYMFAVNRILNQPIHRYSDPEDMLPPEVTKYFSLYLKGLEHAKASIDEADYYPLLLLVNKLAFHEETFELAKLTIPYLEHSEYYNADAKQIVDIAKDSLSVHEFYRDELVSDVFRDLFGYTECDCESPNCSNKGHVLSIKAYLLDNLNKYEKEIRYLKENYPAFYRLQGEFFDDALIPAKVDSMIAKTKQQMLFFIKRNPGFLDEDDGEEGVWLPQIEPIVREGPKVGRNDPCPCGSGKKYKKCCA